VRILIGGIGAAVNAACIPIFHVLGKTDDRDKSISNFLESVTWISRGLIESKPIIGNSLMWSYDSFRNRLRGEYYSSGGTLFELKFTPILSFLTGALRSARGISGIAIGLGAQAYFNAMQAFTADPNIETKLETAHTFTKESILEIPQGLLEMIPLCDQICPPLAECAQRLEQKKIELWRPPHQQ
jgi:hypothetical protein